MEDSGSPAAPSPSGNTRDNDKITLQVGERQFITLRSTLVAESTYFAARLSGRWNDTGEDGSYFIDADPEIFEHILRYLRNGSFPLLFDHDKQILEHAKYLALLADARYFGIRRLEEWIQKMRYLDIVHIQKSILVREIRFPGSIDLIKASPTTSRLDVSTSWVTKQIYVCPKGQPGHRGDVDECNRRCRIDHAGHYESVTALQAVVVETNMWFNSAVCMDG
ncbi:BTB/POZ protein [Hypomontagnella monticulosa]|nr:BTB/POZ protein [Hypomontagnella monticulosa]